MQPAALRCAPRLPPPPPPSPRPRPPSLPPSGLVQGPSRPHHKSVFDFDEDALLVGASVFVELVEGMLAPRA